MRGTQTTWISSTVTSQRRVAKYVQVQAGAAQILQPERALVRDLSNDPEMNQPQADYQAILLALADNYTATAYDLARTQSAGYLQEYFRLMSTAIACLESVLNNYRQTDARKELRIRLRLGSLLLEETDNDKEVRRNHASQRIRCW